MQKRHEISDSEWEHIKNILPEENRGEGRPSKPNRLMLNGMLGIAKTGSPWSNLPEWFGPWQTVYSCFRLWSKNDVFLKLFEHLTSDADYQDLVHIAKFISTQQVQKNAKDSDINQNIELSQGGKNTKIHAIIDGLGNPLKLCLASGNTHDSSVVVEVLSNITISGSVILADKAYGNI